MAAFYDGTCPKCHRRVGWFGELRDRPPCPGCGHQIPMKELEADEEELRKAEEEILKKFKSRKKKGK